MNSYKPFLKLWIAGLPLLLWLFACGGGSVDESTVGGGDAQSAESTQPEADEETFRIGLVTWVGSGPFYLAKERNLYQGADVELLILDDAGGRRAALARGSIDAMLATVDDFANLSAAGLSAVAVLKTDDSRGGDGIVAGPSIQRVPDLQGKTVAFPKGMPSHFFLLHVLERHGMGSGDIIPRDMNPGDAGTAFIAGEVDAAVTWEPYLSNASQREGGHVLTSTMEYPGLISDILVVREDVLRDRPETIQRVLSGWFTAIEEWRTHGEASNQLMADALSLSIDDFRGMLGGVEYADLPTNLAYFQENEGTSPFLEVFENASRVWEAEGIAPRITRPKRYVNSSFIEALAAASASAGAP